MIRNHTFRRLVAFLAFLLPIGAVVAAPGTAFAAGCNTATTGPWKNNCTVSQGASSKLVEVIQYSVNQENAFCPVVSVDGIFGPATLAGVKCFQSHLHLTADGIVGPNTWNAMEGILLPGPLQGNWNYLGYYGGAHMDDRYWVPSGAWYFLGRNGTYLRMDSSAPE
jgi:hypothetical protein